MVVFLHPRRVMPLDREQLQFHFFNNPFEGRSRSLQSVSSPGERGAVILVSLLPQHDDGLCGLLGMALW